MKTFLVDAGYIFDPEEITLERSASKREAISRIYIAPEECIVKFDDKEKTAKKGDIIIVFYEDRFPEKFIVVKSKDWRNNIETYEKTLQKDKEKWALKEAQCSDCCDCECSSSVSVD